MAFRQMGQRKSIVIEEMGFTDSRAFLLLVVTGRGLGIFTKAFVFLTLRVLRPGFDE